MTLSEWRHSSTSKAQVTGAEVLDACGSQLDRVEGEEKMLFSL